MAFKPANKWIVMSPIAESEILASGLYLAPSTSNNYTKATVVAIPPKLPEEAAHIVVGCVVFYDKVGEVRIGRGKDETVLVPYLNVLSVVE